MARYNEKIVTGDMVKYQVSNDGYFYYTPNPQITFNLDEITILPDGTESLRKGVDSIRFDVSAPETEFNVLNPVDDSVVGTATYGQVFAILYSLFFHGVSLK